MKLISHKSLASHRDIFLERYERLLAWTLQMTERDRALAEDLLHDAFILFTVNQPDLQSIENMDGYLYTLLRNLHLSQMRKGARRRFQQLSVAEYDSAATGLRQVDVGAQIQAQDELRRICYYACARKETSKAGSVLILRFFHGYYPSEIVRVLRATRKAVDDRLRVARAEAKLFLENPKGLSFIGDSPAVEPLRASFARPLDDFLNELRHTIYRSRQGECLPAEQLEDFYRTDETPVMGGARLAHTVSCPRCLEEVNKLLGLPSLADRYSVDAVDKDMRPKDGSGGGTAGGGAAHHAPKSLCRRWERDAQETFEHKPQELCVSVNGYLLGSQKIGDTNELTLSIKGEERISFVEVFSEQGVRLSLMSASDPPPEGPGEQRSQVGLSDQRTLRLTLKFSNPWPVLHVVYQDPALQPETAQTGETEENGAALPTTSSAQAIQPGAAPARERLMQLWTEQRWSRFSNRQFWLRPGAVTALFAVILIAALVLLRLYVAPPVISAAELLRRSSVAEEAIAARTDQVLQRTIKLEKRQSSGELIARYRIEVWQSAKKGITARRLYDEQNKLVAGDWRRSDGVRTLYRSGSQPQLQLTPEKRGAPPALDFDRIWQLDPSAKDFTRLINDTRGARVEEGPDAYAISYAGDTTGDADGLVRATLVLTRADFHPVEQTLLVRQASEVRQYKFVESAFERRAPESVAPQVFEPEPELLGATTKRAESAVEPPKKESASPEPLAVAPSRVVATAELEVEALRLLNVAGADMGEQVSVTRTPEGRLDVQALVETENRKQEILRFLAPVIGDPAVKVFVETVSEATERQSRGRKTTPGPTVISRVEVNRGALPVEPELRAYFTKNEGRADELIAQFASRMINRSQRALFHALALKRLAGRFSAEQLRAMDAEARAKWLSMMQGHARSFAGETAGLRQELEPVFSAPSSAAKGEGIEIRDDADLQRAVERLFELAAANDRVIQSAFTTSTGVAAVTPALKTPQFWQSLLAAEGLAARIQLAQ